MSRILTFVLCFSVLLPLPAVASDADRLIRAMELMRKGEWSNALSAAGEQKSVSRDIIEWHRLRAGLGKAGDVTSFLDRRSDWPGLAWLRRKGEAAVNALDREGVLKFYADESPQSPEGVLGHARALIESGNEGDGKAEIVLAWRTMPMGRAIQADYLKRHKKLLEPHHNARLDRLLWDNHMVSARRMLPLVEKGHRALAEARIALLDMAPGVDTKIAAVPKALQGSPGLGPWPVCLA